MERKERCNAQRVTADGAQVEKLAAKAGNRSSGGNGERKTRTKKESRTAKRKGRLANADRLVRNRAQSGSIVVDKC